MQRRCVLSNSQFGLITLTAPLIPSDAYMCQLIGSTLVHVALACCLVGVKQSFVNQYWLIVDGSYWPTVAELSSFNTNQKASD